MKSLEKIINERSACNSFFAQISICYNYINMNDGINESTQVVNQFDKDFDVIYKSFLTLDKSMDKQFFSALSNKYGMTIKQIKKKFNTQSNIRRNELVTKVAFVGIDELTQEEYDLYVLMNDEKVMKRARRRSAIGLTASILFIIWIIIDILS